MRHTIIHFITLLIITVLLSTLLPAQQFVSGVDVSFLPQIEMNGGSFRVNGIISEPLSIYKSHGITYARLRLWKNPADHVNDLTSTVALAQRIRAAGMLLLLDLHYSDTWADPAHQTKPLEWTSTFGQALQDSVYTYTKLVMGRLKNEGCVPSIVQIGNEISCGFLWDDAKVCGAQNTPAQWQKLGSLIQAGVRGVRDVFPDSTAVKLMIHIDRGGNLADATWFYDNLLQYTASFDYIGLSFYPWWHGSLSDARNTVSGLIQKYHKGVFIVETAYPWTLSWKDSFTNIVGTSDQLLSGYPATPDGQAAYIHELINTIKNCPENLGKGVFYWAPDWISLPSFASAWENLTLFDFSGNALPALDALGTTNSVIKASQSASERITIGCFPNPCNAGTEIVYTLPGAGFTTIKIYSLLGEEIRTLVNGFQQMGRYKVIFSALSLPSGVYFCSIQSNSYSSMHKICLIK
ncbi:MAG: glycosyl hydrolase 53 family protein [Ignavibacteria bacterium]|nr:glycosyl hydrolase 53 family protein [Ignavibacteria bacterium]